MKPIPTLRFLLKNKTEGTNLYQIKSFCIISAHLEQSRLWRPIQQRDFKEKKVHRHWPLHKLTTSFLTDIKWNSDASEKHMKMQINTALYWNHLLVYPILAYSPKFNCKQSNYGTEVIKYTKQAWNYTYSNRISVADQLLYLKQYPN